MEPLRQSGRISGLLVLGLLALGCAHSPVAAPSVAPEIRESLGRMGVAYEGPASLWANAKPLRGAGRGAGRGVQAVVEGVFQPMFERGDPRGLVGLILFGPPIAGVGALVGAVLAPSEAAVVEAETVLNEAVVDPDLVVGLRDRFLQAVQRRRPQARVTLPLSDTGAAEESLAPVAWAREGITTVLEARGPAISLMKGSLSGSINPSLRLSVRLGTRVIRTADGSVLYWSSLVYEGETRTYTGWAANNAQPLREAVLRAMETLVQQSVALVFGPETAGGEAAEATP